MKLIEIISGAIGKVWNFATTILKSGLVFSMAIFVISIFMPDNVLRAIEIAKNLIFKIL